MRLLVCGSRTITDAYYIFNCIDDADILLKHQITEIIEGQAEGVDKIAGRYAISHQLNLLDDFIPDWKRFGKGAGKIRSKEMVDLCDKGIAIWDGVSTGTEYTIMLLRNQNKLLKIYGDGYV